MDSWILFVLFTALVLWILSKAIFIEWFLAKEEHLMRMAMKLGKQMWKGKNDGSGS